MKSNAVLVRALRDPDPTVRSLAENALWAVWFRADTPENNEKLEQAAALLARHRYVDAIGITTRLVEKSPEFAEAYNQRAIAQYRLGRFDESAEDCRRALARNPYHTGALAGLAQCLVQLDRRAEAIEALRRASRIQPFSEGIRRFLAELEGSRD
jgi:tetratricopeptide (TPR) repeat protein